MGKNIYQVWYQGEKAITSKKYLNNMKQWQSLNPEWSYKLLDESDLLSACKLYSKRCARAFNRTLNMHTRIDLARLVQIFLTGGINVDMDMYVLRPLEYNTSVAKFVNDGSSRHKFGVSSLALLNNFESRLLNTENTFNNAMTMSTKGNPLLKYVIDSYITIILSLKETDGGMIYVHKTTGPKNFNLFVNKGHELFKDSTTLKIFKSEVFEPYDSDGSCQVTDKTIAIHKFEMSWVPPRVRPFIGFYLKNKILVYIVIMFIITRLFT